MLALRSASLARGGVRAFSASALVEAHHKIVVVGQGSAGTAVTQQLKRAFAGEKRPLSYDDVAVIEPAKDHHCKRLSGLGGPSRAGSELELIAGNGLSLQTSLDGLWCRFYSIWSRAR